VVRAATAVAVAASSNFPVLRSTYGRWQIISSLYSTQHPVRHSPTTSAPDGRHPVSSIRLKTGGRISTISAPDLPRPCASRSSTETMDRRRFLRSSAAGVGGLLVPAGWLAGCTSQARTSVGSGAGGWDLVPEILSRIRPPQFPDRDFIITDFGARPAGNGASTEAIASAIQACAEAGGGRVVVPEGE